MESPSSYRVTCSHNQEFNSLVPSTRPRSASTSLSPLIRPFAPTLGPSALTLGPSAPTLGRSALTPKRSAPTQGPPRTLKVPPRCSPGMSVAPPQSPPSGPSPPRALSRRQLPALLHAAPLPTPRSPRPLGPGTRGERTLADAQAQPPGHAPSGGSGTCGMTSPSDPMKSKHAEATNKRFRGQGQIRETHLHGKL